MQLWRCTQNSPELVGAQTPGGTHRNFHDEYLGFEREHQSLLHLTPRITINELVERKNIPSELLQVARSLGQGIDKELC